MTKNYTLSWQRHELRLGPQTTIMGIVNVTPDSFSDGGRFHAKDAAVAQALRLVESGADIIDIGGESTRPYADPVSAQKELQRVIPVIEKLASDLPVPISIDTTKSQVAAAAVKAGAAMVNDISALRADPDMALVVAKSGVPVILMHMQGQPHDMQVKPEYADVVAEVGRFLAEAIDRAVAAGIMRDKIIIDPGIGFGKTGRHNLLLMRRLEEFKRLDAPLLVGTSRKRFIREILNPVGRGDLSPELPRVETGTQATVAAAVMRGAHIVRVHNVANTRATVDVIDAIIR